MRELWKKESGGWKEAKNRIDRKKSSEEVFPGGGWTGRCFQLREVRGTELR